MSVAPAESIFGPVVSGWDVGQWVLAVLKRWSGTYLSEYERQHGIAAGTLPRIRAWRAAQTFNKWPEDQLPAIAVISVGFAEPPRRDGRGSYAAKFLFSVGAIASARTEEKTWELCHAYLTAHRDLLLQRPSLEGRAASLRLLADDYNAQPYEDNRSIGSANTGLEILVEDIARANAGPVTPEDPLVPDTTPWPDDPDVATYDVDLIGHGTDPLPPEGG